MIMKIRILHKINKKGYFKQKCQASEQYVNFYALNTWWHECDQSVALLRCNEDLILRYTEF